MPEGRGRQAASPRGFSLTTATKKKKKKKSTELEIAVHRTWNLEEGLTLGLSRTVKFRPPCFIEVFVVSSVCEALCELWALILSLLVSQISCLVCLLHLCLSYLCAQVFNFYVVKSVLIFFVASRFVA